MSTELRFGAACPDCGQQVAIVLQSATFSSRQPDGSWLLTLQVPADTVPTVPDHPCPGPTTQEASTP